MTAAPNGTAAASMPHAVMGALAAEMPDRFGRAFGESGWRALGDLVPDAAPGLVCELAVTACIAVGGRPSDAYPAAAALHMAFLSISLVDGVLDGEPYRDLSPGRTANVASALEAAAVLSLCDLPRDLHHDLARRIARLLIDTACGQERDVAARASNDDEWAPIDAKTAPLFEAALYCGARQGGASEELARTIEHLGRFIGRLIQVQDDLTDVLTAGNDADWIRPSSNVVLRFATHVDHAHRARVGEILSNAAREGPARREMRRILSDCGAVSFSLAQLLVAGTQAIDYLDSLAIDAAPLRSIVEALVRPARAAVQDAGGDHVALTSRLAAISRA